MWLPQKVHINYGAVHAHPWCGSNCSSISNNSRVCKGSSGTYVLGSGMKGCLGGREGVRRGTTAGCKDCAGPRRCLKPSAAERAAAKEGCLVLSILQRHERQWQGPCRDRGLVGTELRGFTRRQAVAIALVDAGLGRVGSHGWLNRDLHCGAFLEVVCVCVGGLLLWVKRGAVGTFMKKCGAMMARHRVVCLVRTGVMCWALVRHRLRHW